MSYEQLSTEAIFAANLREARAAAGMTQAELAEAMTKRGCKWYGPTVYKVENGERQILLVEALALAEILGRGINELATPADQLKSFYKFRAEFEAFLDALLKLKGALGVFATKAPRIRQLIADTPEVEKLLPPGGLENLHSFVDADSPVLKSVIKTETLVNRWGSNATEA